MPKDAAIMDYGAGYGRVLELLVRADFRNLIGLDPCPEMVRRAQARVPNVPVSLIKPSQVPFPDASFDAVVLYSVLSSLLDRHAQTQLVASLARALRPGGIFYFNDFGVQAEPADAERYRRGYALGAARYGDDAVFLDSEADVAFFHFTSAHLESLFTGFCLVDFQQLPSRSMNGSMRDAFQLMIRRSPDDTLSLAQLE